MKKLLITGISGFLGSHAAIAALNRGYAVTGTLRNINRADSIRSLIGKHTFHPKNLTIAEADLLDSTVWNKLMTGVDGVLHIASPFPRTLPKNDAELVKPAKVGTLNILNAAAKNRVQRVVLTSSIGAIAYGKKENEFNKVFNEKDWTDEFNKIDSSPYFRSKTIAEKAAWTFIKNDITGLELVSICPGAILGPVLEEDFGTSANLVLKMLDGTTPAIPKIGFEVVDVRDVAELHLLALENECANGNRYAATQGFLEFSEVADILRKQFPNRKIPSKILPNFMVKIMSKVMPELKPILLELGVRRQVTSEKAFKELGWKPRTADEAVIACAYSLFKLKTLI